MNIRKAQEKDIVRINDLLKQVNKIHHIGRPDLFNLGTKYTSEQLAEIIRDEKRPILVAADQDDTVIGYAFCIFQQHIDDNILTDIKTLYIDDLCVDKNHRGQHIGKHLYNEVLAFAKENHCYHVTLNVWQLNEDAMKFYQACGMQVMKTAMEVIL